MIVYARGCSIVLLGDLSADVVDVFSHRKREQNWCRCFCGVASGCIGGSCRHTKQYDLGFLSSHCLCAVTSHVSNVRWRVFSALPASLVWITVSSQRNPREVVPF